MKYNSEMLEVIHQDATEMFKVGAITESEMREFDELCLSNPKTENKSSPVYANDNSVNTKHITKATA
ncbi:hypothetical protein [Treponema sp. R80B11-R83G3]